MQEVACSGSQSEPTDERLLRDYAAGRDGGAFATLMRRHGGMVLGVCRRTLGREQDAEDAFQATFLVLMRKAPSLSRPNLLGNWLYGVAYRIARKMRNATIGQREREAAMVDLPAREDDDTNWRELRPILDDEVQRLPERYRTPLVLFYLEGKSAEEIATALGRPRGTVLSQLARGRERLRGQLTRRKLIVSSGLLAALPARTASADAAIPEPLLDWAMRATALPQTAGGAYASAQAQRLAQAFLRRMLRRRLVAIAGIGLGLLLLAGLWGTRLRPGVEAKPPSALMSIDTRSDLGRLQGGWQVVAVEIGGKALPRDRLPFSKLWIRDDTIVHETRGHGLYVVFRVHPEQEPKAMDILANSYHSDLYGVPNSAIYKLERDTLTICRSDNEERPKEFVSTPGSRILLYTAQRIQPVGP